MFTNILYTKSGGFVKWTNRENQTENPYIFGGMKQMGHCMTDVYETVFFMPGYAYFII